MTPSKSTALVPFSGTNNTLAKHGSSLHAQPLLAGEDVTLHNREEVRKHLPDILAGLWPVLGLTQNLNATSAQGLWSRWKIVVCIYRQPC